jgi:cyanophycinase-like exopeptidase
MLFLLNFALPYLVTEIMSSPKILLLFLITYSTYAFSQPGRLLLVGGGEEKNGVSSWSTPAYKWAGNGKRIAIIGTSTGALAPYFKQWCGAAYAKEFAIASRDSANSQVLYDTLLTYQVIFFRGGDQSEYYDFYRNTKLQDAVVNLYNNGGTICGTSAGMHILSSVVYTAANGTVYSYECIENPNNKYVTLANDFMNFAPGFVFDTHVAERARFGRTVGFLANYKMNKGIDITGIGMDDMTCMTVDETGLATVRGTGCANITMAGGTYSLNGTKLLADKVHVMQLLQGCTYNLNTKEVTFNTLNRQINSSQFEETGNYTVLASGSNKLTENQAMLADLVTGNGLTTDPVLIVTGDETLANTFKDKLLSLGTTEVNIALINADAGSSSDIEIKINAAVKILFISNTTATFNQFLNTTNGGLLAQKVHTDGMIAAFVGDDSRYAGKTVVDNYYTLYASYYAELTFSKGLSLLHHSVIMPNTFYNSDMYENSATAVPYAISRDTLKYGIWLTNHNYMKFTPVDGKATLTGYGAAPVMVISNEGSLSGFSTQTGNGSNSAKPRMIAGFDHLELSMIDYTTPYIMGNVNITGVTANLTDNSSVLLPNPVKDKLNFTAKDCNYTWEIYSTNGSQLLNGQSDRESINLNVAGLKPGMYLFITHNLKTNLNTSTKFIKE